MAKKVTSSDVAKLAGVSQPSVSLILNDSGKVSFSNETKERVFAAAQALGYQPKHQRRVVRRHSDMILVLTPTLSNPYYCELSQSIESYAASRDYHAIICNTFRRPSLEKYYLDAFAGGKVGGIIYTFLPSFPRVVEQLGQHYGKRPCIVEQLAKETPVILIGEKKNDLTICSIELSNHTAGALLAEHLYLLDHRDVTFISTPTNQTTLAREQRLEGMREFFARQGLDHCVHVIEADCDTEDDFVSGGTSYEYRVAQALTEQFLQSGSESTALIGANDMIAVGICETLKRAGFRVPEDYSVCGFDNIFMSSLLSPPLTTVDHRLHLRSKFAVDMVVDRGQAPESKATEAVNKIEYAPTLIVRASTSRRKQRRQSRDSGT